MSRVFVSYSAKDQDNAKEIVSILENQGISCWYAPRDVPAGSDYLSSLASALDASKYFLLLLSDPAQHSPNVIHELELAIRSQKIIIPLKTEDFLLTDVMDFYLGTIQIRDYTRAKKSVIDNIITFIQSSEPAIAESHSAEPIEDPPVYHVFVSHSTANDQIAQSIVDHLEKQNVSCWIAPRDTRSHTTFPAQITQAVRNCPVFLLLISQKAMESSHVEREISLAIDRKISFGYKYIIPLMLEDCTLTDEFCYYLANLHYYAYYQDEDGILAKVTAQIHQFIEKDKYSAYEYVNEAQRLFREKRYREAFLYYQKAAQLDNTEAQGMLGYCYHTGKGCDRDIRKAIRWYQKAADGGSINAQANLALCYSVEGDATRDMAKAVSLFHGAADKGHAGAQRHLGSLYEKGLGVPQNMSIAKKWYEKSAAQGDDFARKKLQEFG